MKLDRAYQLRILNMLSESYPQSYDIREYIRNVDEIEEAIYKSNMVYLDEYGLVECGIQFGADGFVSYSPARITHRGMDFIADDGGIGAILGVVTIKIHDETLKALIAQKIEQSNLPPADKHLWLDTLRKIPEETMKHLAVKLMDLGLAHAPDALQQVGTLLGFLR